MISALSTIAFSHHPIVDEIVNHSSWLGLISGLEAEKMLRGKTPFSYALRQGEFEMEYYITFVGADCTVRHQPFIIAWEEATGWYAENAFPYSLRDDHKFEELVHLIIHAEKGTCTPVIKK